MICKELKFVNDFFRLLVSCLMLQFALVRTKSTGRVATDRVYEHGCYVLGADKEFVYLDRTVQMIEFKNLGMFTRDNVDLSIDAQVYYVLKYVCRK